MYFKMEEEKQGVPLRLYLVEDFFVCFSFFNVLVVRFKKKPAPSTDNVRGGFLISLVFKFV